MVYLATQSRWESPGEPICAISCSTWSWAHRSCFWWGLLRGHWKTQSSFCRKRYAAARACYCSRDSTDSARHGQRSGLVESYGHCFGGCRGSSGECRDTSRTARFASWRCWQSCKSFAISAIYHVQYKSQAAPNVETILCTAPQSLIRVDAGKLSSMGSRTAGESRSLLWDTGRFWIGRWHVIRSFSLATLGSSWEGYMSKTW